MIFIYDSSFSRPADALAAGSYFGTSGLISSPAYSYLPLVYGTWECTNLVVSTEGYIPPPSATAYPATQTAISGGQAIINVHVTKGIPPYEFQWYFGTNVLAGKTNASLTLTNLQSSQSGEYSVKVTGAGVSSNSSPALLSVVPGLGIEAVVPLLTLRGDVGSDYSLEYINAIGPTNNWVPLVTLTITNNPQPYIDTSAAGKPTRLYRLVKMP